MNIKSRETLPVTFICKFQALYISVGFYYFFPLKYAYLLECYFKISFSLKTGKSFCQLTFKLWSIGIHFQIFTQPMQYMLSFIFFYYSINYRHKLECFLPAFGIFCQFPLKKGLLKLIRSLNSDVSSTIVMEKN